MSRGKLVVVGGHSRRVGKTCIVNAILHATPAMAWHVVKISNHAHRSRANFAPTATAELLRLTDAEFPQGVRPLADMLADGCNLLVESNRVVLHLPPDLVLFVLDPQNPDWKESSAACLAKADALVFSRDGPCPAPLSTLPQPLPAFRLTCWNQEPLALGEWLRERLDPATLKV